MSAERGSFFEITIPIKGGFNLSNTSTDTATSSSTIKMVENALTVLDALHSSHMPLGVNEIAKNCNLSPSTAFRILKTLCKSEWAFQLSDDRYISGQKLSFVTEQNNLFLALADVSFFVMQEYTTRYNRAMNLMIRENDHCKILQQSRTSCLVDYIPPLYSILPIYACACGKVLLSELPVNIVEQIIQSCKMVPLTKHTITDPDLFWQNLRKTASNGYALEDKESSESGSCIAVPVRDNKNNIIAALSFSGFIGIPSPDKQLLEYLPALKEASTKISQQLYHCYPQITH